MKRYKVVGHSFSARNGVPSGLEDFMQKLEDANAEICLEEVKEEKEHRHCWEKMEQLNADHGDCEFCCECKRPYQPCGVKRATDQPLTELTPKDVGMRNGQAIICFESWLDAKNIDLFYVKDEDYEPMYQKFLKSCKK